MHTTTLLLAWLVATAPAAPTPEEEALQAALEGRRADAVRALEREGDPDARWLAGRVALRAGDPATAWRLFDAPDARSIWGRIEVEVARGDPLAAARDALAQMDAALGGKHRDALGRLLVDWAAERAPTDPANAARFLGSAIGFDPSEAVRREAEDAWFRLPPDSTTDEALQAAVRRALAEPTSVPARLRVAAAWHHPHPSGAAAVYADLMRSADRDDAFAAASRLVGLPVPDPLVVEPLVAMAARFPNDEPLARLRLDHAVAMAGRDEAAGTAALLALEAVPTVATAARIARAEATTEPRARRARWLALAATEGVTALGDRARAEARQALLNAVEATPEGAERRAFAAESLREPDGAREPLLQFHAIPEGPGRQEALWKLSEAFSSGPWCEELAEALVHDGTTVDVAERYVETCSGSSIAASALSDHANETTSLWLLPADGRIDALASSATELQVSQHRVDAEALFRATEGNPLDGALDAFLLEPDATWTVPMEAGALKASPLRPRGRADLVALTVRAGDQRATAFVRPDPLDVSLLRQGDDVAIAVLRDDRPVAGAALLVQDTEGVTHKAKTGADGIARFDALPTSLRVLATHAGGLGFATMDAGGDPWEVDERYAVVVWDRAVADEGAPIDVQVFGTRPAGGVDADLSVVSRTLRGEALDRVPVRLVAGAGQARLFAQGGGRVELVDADDEVLAGVATRRSNVARHPVRIALTPADPRPGDVVVAAISVTRPLGPAGLAAQVRVRTGWSDTNTAVNLGPEGASFEIPLAPGQRDAVGVWVTLPDGVTVSNHVEVAPEPPPGPLRTAPAVVGVGQGFPVSLPEGAWLRATLDGQSSTLWFRDQVHLPTAGTWRLCAWRDTCGPGTPVTVASGDLEADGRWRGPPVLTGVAAEGLRDVRIALPGDRLLVGDTSGTRHAWLTLAHPEARPVPLRGEEAPAIAVTGTLSRGDPAAIEVGSGLPPGSRLWAFLRDAPDGRRTGPASVAAAWDGSPAVLGDAWSAEPQWGQEIAAALLQEEERLAEQRAPERLDFGFSAAMEEGLGMSGYGSGGGAFGSRGSGGVGVANGRASGTGGIERRDLPGEPRALGVFTDVSPGSLSFTVPAWVGAADLEVVARTPDGRWASRVVRLDVAGGPLAPLPEVAPWVAPPTWSGDRAVLVEVARSLPIDARVQALAALDRLGVPGASLPLTAAWSEERAPSGPEAVLARHVAGLPGAQGNSDLAAIPDPRRADRAEAALSLAPTDPDRAKAAAARLLGAADLEPWVRTRAGLALWVAGAPDEADAALSGPYPMVAAARAVATGKAEPAYAPMWWFTARSEGAHAGDRALALHALALLPRPTEVRPTGPSAAPVTLRHDVETPLAELRGQVFARGTFTPGAAQPALLPAGERTVPRLRQVPLRLVIPASTLPTRLACPEGPTLASTSPWIELAPSPGEQWVTCRVAPQQEGPVELIARWYGPDGAILGDARAAIEVTPARDARTTDPVSEQEKIGLGIRLAADADPQGLDLLESLLATSELPAHLLRDVSEALLSGRRQGAAPAGLIQAFQAYREHVPDGVLDLETAAALAHAYAAVGDPRRALAASHVVLDARFKEELAAVSELQAGGLGLTALKLLRELLDRYPEGPTVITARYLAPSMLLNRAEGDQDRLGYTRSSLRHTAAAELAGFLLVHPEATEAPEAAVLLADALHALGDPERERALAGPLARRYGRHASAWRLSLADARATLAAGQPALAAKILASLNQTSSGLPEVELERGRVFEALGRLDEARSAYERSGDPEAWERLAWLDRSELDVPATLVLTPGLPAVIRAHLPQGTEVSVAAIRVQLEAALLRDGGTLDAAALNVAGLRPTATRTFTVGVDGDVPLPTLPEGAYVVTVATGGLSQRLVVIRTDAELVVDNRTGSGSMIHLADTRGGPLAGAQLWLFTGDGTVETARTDGRGAVWVPFGGGQVGVLARTGDRYAVANLGAGGSGWGSRGATGAAPPAAKHLLQKNEAAYDELFRQEREQRVKASGL